MSDAQNSLITTAGDGTIFLNERIAFVEPSKAGLEAYDASGNFLGVGGLSDSIMRQQPDFYALLLYDGRWKECFVKKGHDPHPTASNGLQKTEKPLVPQAQITQSLLRKVTNLMGVTH